MLKLQMAIQFEKYFLHFSILFYILWTIFSIQTNYHFQMDQGQFALRSLDIVKNKELTLLGPTTSIKTVTGKHFFQGPLFYYISGAILTLNSNPVFLWLYFSLLNSDSKFISI